MSHCALSQNESETKTQVMLCYYRTEAKRSIDALKRIKSYQREEEETTEV